MGTRNFGTIPQAVCDFLYSTKAIMLQGVLLIGSDQIEDALLPCPPSP